MTSFLACLAKFQTAKPGERLINFRMIATVAGEVKCKACRAVKGYFPLAILLGQQHGSLPAKPCPIEYVLRRSKQ
jgi:hypothetical protein